MPGRLGDPARARRDHFGLGFQEAFRSSRRPLSNTEVPTLPLILRYSPRRYAQAGVLLREWMGLNPSVAHFSDHVGTVW